MNDYLTRTYIRNINNAEKMISDLRETNVELAEKIAKHEEILCDIKELLDIDTEYLGYFPNYKKLKKRELINIIKVLNYDLLQIEKAVVKGGLI